MTEVLFYHLTDSSLEAVLPTLLEKSLERGWKAVVQAGSDERRDALDSLLWTYREDSFIAHGTDQEKYPDQQPVILTTSGGNPNKATVRFLVDGAKPPPLEEYDRVVLLFDGHDTEHLDAARAQWKLLKSQGLDVTYWQQTPQGRWEKKA